MKSSRVLLLAALVSVAACARKPKPESTPAPQTPPETTSQPQTSDVDRAREAEEARRREMARAMATLAEPIHFGFDESELTSDARAILDRKVSILSANSDVRVRVEGHADERGTVEYNLALSLRRANAAKAYITGFGIDASRIEVTGFGEERPLDAGHNEDAWAQNRRAEFRVLAGLAAAQ